MSLVEKYLHGWRRRSSTPDFDPGEEYQVVLTGFDETEGAAVARVGDTEIYVDGTGREYVDTVAVIRVTEFDGDRHRGRAELVEVVGETTY